MDLLLAALLLFAILALVLGVLVLILRPRGGSGWKQSFPAYAISTAVIAFIVVIALPFAGYLSPGDDLLLEMPSDQASMDIGDILDISPAAGPPADQTAGADAGSADGAHSVGAAPDNGTAGGDPGVPRNGHDAPAMANGGSHDDNFARVQVFYGTDRKVTGDSKPAEFYGGDRGAFVYGQCEVSIPRDHRLGELESPSIWRLEFREDPEKHVVLLSLREQAAEDFFADLQTSVTGTDARQALVFVHGYNVSFADAARRTAQLAYDLGYDGAPVFYSWPSQGKVAGYPVDETNVRWGMPHLRAFLNDIAARSGAEAVHLVAHSMGNRALTEALADIAGEANAPLRGVLREVVLTAPDIDAEVFMRDLVPRLAVLGARITLYASSEDKALLASKRFHGYPRAGEAGASLVVVPSLDTVDATGMDTSLFGHSYFAETKSVMSDLFYLINQGKPPPERFALEPVSSERGQYWRFKR